MNGGTAGSTNGSNTERWSGAALAVGAVLGIVAMLIHPLESDPQGPMKAAWMPAHVLLILTFFLSVFGWFALYNRIAARSQAWGAVALVTALYGWLAFLVVIFFEGLGGPVIAGDPATQKLLDPNGALFNGPFGMGIMLGAILASVGFILMGVLLFREGSLPKWAAVLLCVAPVWAFSPPIPDLVSRGGIFIFFVGMLGLAYSLWRAQGAKAA